MYRIAILAFLILCTHTPCGAQLVGQADDARPWVSRDGKSRVVGTLAELSADHAVITLTRSDNQVQVQVPVERLSALDYLFIRDYVRRSVSEEVAEEWQTQLPMAYCPGNPQVERWILRPAMSINLPPGATKWKLVSSQPILYGAYVVTEDSFPELCVYYDRMVPDGVDRISRILEQNEASIRFLEERGASEVTGDFLQEDPGMNFQKSVLTGSTFSGTPITCETHLRFDLQGIIVFRVFGSPERIQEIIPTIDDFRYLDSDDLQPPPGQPDSLETTLTSEVPSSVASDIRSDFGQFLDRAIGLLSKSNNAKEVMERLSEPEGLKKLKQNVDRWDSAVISFDVRKRLRLKTVLGGLDWATASYSEENRVLTFVQPESIQFVKTDDGWKIIN